MPSIRADQRLVELGLAASRSKAQALILAGSVVTRAGQRIVKAGQPVAAGQELCLKGEPLPFVSRGGLKLAAALDEFGLDPRGWTVLDVGASTGGFTDCLLQRGATRVYALDVGYNQLAWELRTHDRVVSMERVNIRNAGPDLIPEKVDALVFDVSFISLERVIPPALDFAKPHAELIALVKPQFEVGRQHVGKGGIVRNDEARMAAVRSIEGLISKMGLTSRGTMPSPITGAKGNQEFLISAYR